MPRFNRYTSQSTTVSTTTRSLRSSFLSRVNAQLSSLRASSKRRLGGFLVFSAVAVSAVGIYVSLAANQTWDGGASGNGVAWYTATNWVGDSAFAGSQATTTNTDIASIPSSGTNPNIGINGTTSATLYLGAIDFSGANRGIGDSAAGSFVLTLNGATVNSVSNVIVRNSSVGTLTLQPNAGGTGSMGVALGNATDNIINIDGSGGVTISSVISGANRKLTKAGAGGGILTLSGVNTYSGDTTIQTGRIVLSGSGSIANSPTIEIAGGAEFQVTGLTTELTMSSGQALKASGLTSTGFIVTATGKGIVTAVNSPLLFSAFNGATPPLTVSSGTGGSLTLQSGNVVTVTTTSPLIAGDYTLIAKSGAATVSGAVPTSLTVNGSGLAPGMGASLQITGQQLVLHVGALPIKYQSKQTGNWNDFNTWQVDLGAGFVDAIAGQTPTSADDTITIQSPHIVTVTANINADQLTVNASGLLLVSSGVTFSVLNGAGTDLTIDGLVGIAGNLSVGAGGEAQVNGVLRIDDGGFPSLGSGTFAYHQTTGTLAFNTTTGTYVVNNDSYWPTSNGPQNVAVGTGNILLNVARTVGLSFETSAIVQGAANLTLNGLFTIFTGGSVTGAPTYGSASTLIYNTPSGHTAGDEWGTGTSGPGVPNNVTIQATSAIVNMGTGTKTILGNMTITSGTFSIGGASGDLHLNGNWSNSGTFDPSNHTVYFEGSAAQTISKSGGETFYDLAINNSSGGVTLNSPVNVDGLNLSSGIVTTSATNLLTVASGPPHRLSGGSASSYINGPLARILPASLASSATYVFPVGKAGFNPFELVNPTTTSGGTVTVQAEEFDGASGGSAGTGLSTLNTNRYWSASITANVANFTNTTVRLTDSTVAAGNVIGKSDTQGGAYDSIGGTVAASTILSDPITSFSFFNIGTAAAAGETDVVLTGGNLVITDANGGNTADTLTISLVAGPNIRVNDPNNALTCGAGMTPVDANTCEVAAGDVTGNIQVDTLGGNDTLTLALAGGDFIPAGGVSYAGGAPTSGSGDKLVITGGAQGTVTYNYTNVSDGSVVMSNFGTVSYTGLEPITNDGTPTDIIFNLPAGPSASGVTLTDDGTSGNTMSRLGGGAFETTDFANPTGSVTINRGHAGDVITTSALPDLTSSLTIGTEALPFQTVGFGGALTLAADKNLSADSAENINLASAASDVATTGTGTITLTAARSVFLVTGASLTVVNGALTLNGNQQLTPFADAFTCININGGTVQTTGSGNIVINGKGGTGDFDGQVGVRVGAGGLLTSTGTGTINVTGTGGTLAGPVNGFGANNLGVLIEGTNSTISSSSASITITGQGGTGAGALATGLHGVWVTDSGKIQANGAGALNINGTGGNITSGGNTNLGEVNSSGVIVNFGGRIESTGTGVNAAAINMTATANAGGDGSSQGFRLDSPATVTTVDGPLSINATGGSCAQLCLGFSIRGSITASGSATIDLTGTGGSGGTSNIGANVRGSGSPGLVSVTNGNLTVTGTGGTGSDNLGFTLGIGIAGSLQSTGNGTITVNADSMNIAPLGAINAGANAASLRQKTAGVAINLGSAVDTTAGTLELSDAELDLVTAATLNIGDASSGSTTISGGIVLTDGPVIGTLNLVTGANVTETFAGDDLTVATLNITAPTGIGGIGGEALDLPTTTLTTNSTGSNGDQFINGGGIVTVGASDLNAGTGTITLYNGGGGRFNTVTGVGDILSDVIVASGGTLGGTGTVSSTKTTTVQSGGTVSPGASPGILNTGNVSFASGSTFSVEIGGTTPGNTATDHDQLNVTGTVDLNSATLSLASFGGFTPTAGQTFVIILNDSTDTIPTTFAGLAEGATIPNFLGSSLSATITYAGGTDSNDVMLTAFAPCVPPSTVYVDDSWVDTTPGTDPDGVGGPATDFGCDSFATIQEGVSGVTAGGTVHVRAGTYAESVLVNKSVALLGAQAGVNANGRFSVFTAGGPPNGPKANPAIESVITAAAVDPGSNVNNTIHVMADNVTIDGFVVDGNNPALSPTGAVIIGGINTDSRRGIQTETAAGVFFPTSNVTVKHNVIQNFAQRGVQLINGGASNTAPATSGGLITENLVRNFGVDGIALFFNAHADITNNTIVCNAYPDVEAGIWVQDFLNVGPSIPMTIANNNVTVGQDNFGGIWVNLAYLPDLNINNNTVNAAAGVTGASDFTYGIYLTSQRPGSDASLTGNIVGASGGEFARGIALWNLGSATPTTVTGGTFGNSLIGLSLHVNDPNFGLAGNNSAVTASGLSISGTATGIYVDASNSTGDTVAMEISGNTSITNTTTAIYTAGANASANIHDNAASIHDNTTGIYLNGGSATLTSNNFYANATSLRFANGGTATAHFNRFISTTAAIDNPGNLTSNLENNWWGCNAGPGFAGCGTVTGTGADFNPWIVLLGSATPPAIAPGGTSTVAADMTHNSAGAVPVGILPNIPVVYSATNGTMNPTNDTIVAGADSSTFTSTNAMNAVATITVDNQNTNVPITVNAPTFSIDDVTHNEGDTGTTSYTFTITKTGTTALSSSVDYATVDGTAVSTGGTPDFTAIPTTNVVFSPTDSTKQFTVLVNGDMTVEPDEAFTVHLSNASGATISDADGTGTITNDDTEVSVVVSPTSVTEDGVPNLIYTFTRIGVTTGTLTANFSVGGTAIFSSDYTASGATTFTSTTGTVSFGANVGTVDVTVDPTADISYEPSETVILTVTSGTGYNVGTNPATGTITDEDAIPTALVVTKTADTNDGFCSLDDCSLREAITNANAISDTNSITFAIPAATDAGCNSLTGVCTIQPTSALPAVDTPVNINGYSQTGASANTLTVGSNAALKIELDGTNAGPTAIGLEFSATLSSVRGLVINRFGLDGIRLTLNTNNVVAGNFIGTDVTGTSASGNGAHGVHLSSASTSTVGGTTAADRNVISGGTTSGAQGIQVAGTGATGNILKGNYIGTNAAGTATIPNAGDGIRLISSPNTVIGGVTALEANVIAGNGQDGIRVNGDSTVIKGNFIGTNSAGAVLGNGQAGIHTVNANNNVIGGTAAGEANTVANNGIKGVFVQSGTGNVIRANSIYSNTGLGIDLGLDSVTANDDGAADDVDTGANNLQNFPEIAAVVVGSPHTISGTLDSTPSQTFTIDFYSSPAGTCDPTGNGEGRTYLGSRSTTTDANGLGGFRFNPATLNANDVVTATATDSAGNTSEFSECVSAEAIAFGEIKFAVANAPNTNDTETNSATHVVNIVVQRVGGADRAVSVDYEITNGTTNPATTPEDYSAANGTLTWANGDATDRNIPITVKGDTKFELDETVSIKLVNAQGGATIAGDNPVTLTIVNDDTQPTISINNVTQNETHTGTSDFDFTVSLSNASYLPITVSAATADNTALTSDSDYTGVPSTLLTFSPDTTTQQFHVFVNGDNKFEANDTFFVNLSGGTNATIADNQGLGTITNDDPLPTISIDNVTHAEGNFHGVANDEPDLTNYDFTVSLSNPSDQTITVDYATANDSAIAPLDYTALTTTTLTFNPGETSKPVTVVVNGDITYELNERFFVNLSNVNVNATILDGQGDGTITNDDAEPTFSINDRSNNEGTMPVPLPSPTPLQHTTQTFTVTKTGSTAVTATVSFATADGSATGNTAPCPSGFDYQSQSSGSLSFGPTETTKSITVQVCKDPDFEANETFFVNLSAPTHATLADSQGQGTILNDDIPSGGFTVNTTDDLDDTICNATHCSLREAITAANGSSTAVAINFAIPASDSRHFYYQDDGAGSPNGQVTLANVATTILSDDSSIVGIDPDWPHSWWSILPTSQLQATTKQVFIDGYSQTGAVPNASLTTANNAVLRIELNGASAGLNSTGLTISGGTSTVRGLAINRFQRDGSAPTPTGNGVSLPSGNNTMSGNFIGTDVSGTLDVGTLAGLVTGSGISTTSFNNVIGGATPDVINLIAGNDRDGISFSNSNTNGIRGNLIGTKANGASALGNGASGLGFTGLGSVANTVGGPDAGQGNTIAFNAEDGISLSNANFGNSIRGNSIFSNGTTSLHLGIDLGTDGVTLNDNLDGDTGPNNLQNFPVITAAMVTGSTKTIIGTLNSSAGDTFIIDFYQSPACAPACGIGEGKTYLGSKSVTTHVTTGDVAFTFNPSVLTIGQFVTATATSTGAGFDTSEFSARTIVADGSLGGAAGDIQFTDATYAVGEAGVTASITLTRVGGTNGQIQTTFTTSDGTATAGSDYTDSDQTVIFNEGESSKTITIPISNDSTYEHNETVNLSLGGSVINATRTGDKDGQLQAQADPHTAVLTITNDDTAPTLSIDSVVMNEGPSGTTNFVFSVTRSGGATAVAATAQYATANGTTNPATGGSCGTAGVDYGSQSETVSVAPNVTSQTITIQVCGDTTVEANDTFFVNLSNPTDATITTNQGLGTINNDDTDVTVAVSPAPVAEDGAPNLVYTFTRNGVTTGALTVNFSVGGTATTANNDYTQTGAATFTPPTGTVTFGAGSTTAPVTINPTTDSTVESDETVILTVTSGTDYNASPTAATGTITNDDTDVTVAVSPSSVTEDGDPNLVYTFTRNGSTTGALTINFSVAGTAAFGADYTQTGAASFNVTSGTVNFAAGNSNAAVTLDPSADATVESDETTVLTVTAGTGYNVASPSSATGTITTDDTDVTVAVSPGSVAEDGVPNLVYTFTRNGVTTGALTVNFSVAGTAAFGTDYTQTGAASFNAASGTVNFAAGDSTAAVTIDPTTDSSGESDETVILTVTAGTGYNAASPSSATGTITNDDAAGGIVRFSAASYNTTENSRFVTITVERTGDTSGAITVDYATPDDSDSATVVPCATVNGFASPRCDFTTALGTLRFAAGETSKTFAVLISQDNYLEGPEALTLTLSNLTGGAVFGVPATATLTIDDDPVEPATNPIDDAENFVRQHYHDFLNREPDASGLAFWTDQITSCGTDQGCIQNKRIHVSAAFYLSIEFQGTGYFVERLYKAAYGDATGSSTNGGAHTLPVPVVRFSEFLLDTQEIGLGVIVGQTGWEAALENNKAAFVARFVERSRFTTDYPEGMTAAQFVDELNSNAGNPLSPAERNQLVSDLSTSTKTRAQVLRAVAEDSDLVGAEFDRAFVLMQYFGYLRRNPNAAPDSDHSGYDFWLTKLNQFNGDFVAAEMVKAFITSGEYRRRAGQ